MCVHALVDIATGNLARTPPPADSSGDKSHVDSRHSQSYLSPELEAEARDARGGRDGGIVSLRDVVLLPASHLGELLGDARTV